jgi:hypothetical protein
VFFSTKRHTAVTAVTCNYFNLDAVNEHVLIPKQEPEAAACQSSLQLRACQTNTYFFVTLPVSESSVSTVLADRSQRATTPARSRNGATFLGRLGNLDVDASSFTVEVNIAFDESEDGVIVAHAYIATGMPLGSLLANQNVARENLFATKLLDPKTLCI